MNTNEAIMVVRIKSLNADSATESKIYRVFIDKANGERYIMDDGGEGSYLTRQFLNTS